MALNNEKSKSYQKAARGDQQGEHGTISGRDITYIPYQMITELLLFPFVRGHLHIHTCYSPTFNSVSYFLGHPPHSLTLARDVHHRASNVLNFCK